MVFYGQHVFAEHLPKSSNRAGGRLERPGPGPVPDLPEAPEALLGCSETVTKSLASSCLHKSHSASGCMGLGKLSQVSVPGLSSL
jgi:hypothetical protein